MEAHEGRLPHGVAHLDVVQAVVVVRDGVRVVQVQIAVLVVQIVDIGGKRGVQDVPRTGLVEEEAVF